MQRMHMALVLAPVAHAVDRPAEEGTPREEAVTPDHRLPHRERTCSSSLRLAPRGDEGPCQAGGEAGPGAASARTRASLSSSERRRVDNKINALWCQ